MPSRPRRHAPVPRWAMALQIIVLLSVTWQSARAATDHVVVDEYFFQCLDGAQGAFVELNADGPGQTYDARIGLRILNASGGVMLDIPSLFADRAGQPWLQGQRFLLAGAGFAELTGVTPDAVLSVLPSTSAGGILLYLRPLSGTTITVLERVEYARGSLTHALPPVGRSAVRTPEGLHVVAPIPTPTNNAGQRATAAGCFAGTVRQLVIQEFALNCALGDRSGGFVEITNQGSSQFLDADLKLRAQDPAGAVLFDMPLGFGSRAGTPWNSGRSWLIGGSALHTAQGAGVDALWPVALDAIGGTLTLYGDDGAGGELVIDRASYGTPELPVPPAGMSLTRIAGGGGYTATLPVTPVAFSGLVLIADQCVRPTTLRVRELLTACSAGPEAASYIELTAVGLGARRDPTLAVEVRDRTGAVQGELPLEFGPFANTTWPSGTSWLLASPGFNSPTGVPPDGQLPFALDRVQGSVRILRRPGGPGTTPEYVHGVSWGGGSPPPAPGTALTLAANDSYALSTTPRPRNVAGEPYSCPPPPDTLLGPVATSVLVCRGCFDGTPRGQYVQIELAANALLDSSFVLRVYDRAGVLLGTRTRLFTGAPATRQPGAGHWLVADESYTLGSPGTHIDALLPAPLDTVAGAIEVVALQRGNERMLQRFSYGGGFPRLPPGGYSTSLPAGTVSFASPVDHAGLSQRLRGCHFFAAPGAFVSEVFLRCIDGSKDLQYISISGLDTREPVDATMSFQIIDDRGRTLYQLPRLLPNGFPVGDGSPLRQFLLAGPRFEAITGVAPDAVLPLDLTQGSLNSVVLQLTRGDGTSSQLSYTTNGAFPPPGRAWFSDPNGISYNRRGPAATRLDGTRVTFPAECADSSRVTPMVLQQFALGCFDGDPRGQFVQLIASGLEDSLTAEYALEVRDRDDQLIDEIAPVFGGRVGLPAASQTLLLAPANTPLPIPRDGTLHAALDTLAGRFTLVRRGAGTREFVWSHTYDRRTSTVAPLGMGFQAGPGDSLIAVFARPQNFQFQNAVLLGCHYTTSNSLPLVVRSVAGACGDGSLAASYVELVPVRSGALLPSLFLRVTDGSGAMQIPLFPEARAFDTWPGGRSLLIAGPDFEATTGTRPDRVLPRPFGATIATFVTGVQDPSRGTNFNLDASTFDFKNLPEPGRALERASNGVLVSTGAPSPRTWDGGFVQVPFGCLNQSGLPDAVQIARVMLRCTNGGTGAQFVQLDRTSTLATRANDLAVRLYDHLGALTGERDSLFGPSPPTFWGSSTSVLLGGPEVQATYGIQPDALLPAALDTLGGIVQLTRPGPDGDRVLMELQYGPGGIPVPPAGSALVWSGRDWTLDPVPVPSGLAATGQPSVSCGANCDVARFQLSLGGPRVSAEPSGVFTEIGGEVRFDQPGRTFRVATSFRGAQLSLSDAFTLTGGLPTDVIPLRVELTEHHRDTCVARLGCFSSGRRALLLVNGRIVDSLAAGVSGTAVLSTLLPFRADGPTQVQLLVSAEARQTPPLDASVEGRWTLGRPRAGARLTSCQGYDSERARVVLDASYAVGPREVRLTWPVFAAPGFQAAVQRLDELEDPPGWETREVRTLEADGTIRFVDHATRPEGRYRYRLAWNDLDGAHVSDEIRVEVPRSFGFFLAATRPNPSRGELLVEFELPEAADVELDVFDVTGRRVRSLHRHYGAGQQSESFAGAGRLGAGLYTLRLRAGGRSSVHRVVVVP